MKDLRKIDYVKTLLDKGYPIHPVYPNDKRPVYWNTDEKKITLTDFTRCHNPKNKIKIDIDDMNIGVVTGTEIRGTNMKLYAFDIDIYIDEAARKNYAGQIMTRIGMYEDFVETTPSGGIHITFLSDAVLDSKKFVIGTETLPDGTIRDKVIELLGKGKQMVISPSRAKNKAGKIGEYISNKPLWEAPFISADKVNEVLEYLETLRIKHGNKTATCGNRELRNYSGKLEYQRESYRIAEDIGIRNVLEALEVIIVREGTKSVSLQCPFHKDNNSSFYVNKKSGICRDEHEGGSEMTIVQLIIELYGDDWIGWLSEKFGISYQEEQYYYWRKSIKELYDFDAEKVEYSCEKISMPELDAAWDRIFLGHEDIFIKADTGAGKTTACIKTADRNGLKMIMLLPYKANVEQLAIGSEKDFGVKVSFVNGTVSDVTAAISESNIIFCVYDSLRKIIECGINCMEYVLVIDEYHDLITQSFREVAIDYIYTMKDRFKKIICLSGTPVGVIYPEDNIVNLEFFPMNRSMSQKKIKIIECDKGETFLAAFNQINNSVHKDCVLLLRNNKNDLEKARLALIENGVPENEIALLTAETKDTPDFQNILTTGIIGKKYILSTQVISDGVNLYDDISSVYVSGIRDVTLIQQFMARPRKGCDDVNIFSKFTSDENLPLPDIRKLYSRFLQLFEQHARSLNNSFPSRGELSLFKELSGKYENNVLYWDDHLSMMRVNTIKIKRIILDILNSILFSDSTRLKEYLEYFQDTETEVISYKTISDLEGFVSYEDLLLNKEKIVKGQAEQDKQKIHELLIADDITCITTYAKNINQSLLFDPDKCPPSLINHKIDPGIIENYFLANYEILKKKTSEQAINNYISFIKAGVPKNIAIECKSLDKNAINYIWKSINTIRLASVIRRHPELKDVAKNSPYYADYLVLQYLLANIKLGDTVVPAHLTSDVNKHLQMTYNLKEVDVDSVKRVQLQYTQKQVISLLNQGFETRRGASIKKRDKQKGNRSSKGYKVHIDNYALASYVFEHKKIILSEVESKVLETELIEKWVQRKVDIFNSRMAYPRFETTFSTGNTCNSELWDW